MHSTYPGKPRDATHPVKKWYNISVLGEGIEISKKKGKGCVKLIGLNYFLALVQCHLLRDRAVAAMILNAIKAAENLDNGSAVVNLNVDFDYC